jgi:hypothetical protein
MATIPFIPAPKGPQSIPESNALESVNFCKTLLLILVARAGGRTGFTQRDFDMAAGMLLLEGFDRVDNFILTAVYPSGRDG